MNVKEKNNKETNFKSRKITMKRAKKQVKRNYTYSSGSNNNCPIDISGYSNFTNNW